MIDAVHELRLGADEEMDVVGEVLRHAKAFEAVSDEVLGGKARGGEPRVEGDGLASGASNAIGDGVRGGVDGATEGAEAGGRDQAQKEVGIGDATLGIIVDAEGLGGEGVTAGVASEARDRAEGGGEIRASGLEVSVGGMRIDLMVDTVHLGAKGEKEVFHAP
jgi:hypothetical protein